VLLGVNRAGLLMSSVSGGRPEVVGRRRNRRDWPI